jgi:putative glycosyltransferase (TIGR04372 family)
LNHDRWVLVARCDTRQAAAEAIDRALASSSVDAHLLAAELLWKHARTFTRHDGSLALVPMAEAAAAAIRQVRAALCLQPTSARAERLAMRLCRMVGAYRLQRHVAELEDLAAFEGLAERAGVSPAPGGDGAWVLYSPAAMGRSTPVLPTVSIEGARSHMVAAFAYLRRCQALALTPERSDPQLPEEAARAVMHAMAAASRSDRTLGALRMLHNVVAFCQQHDLSEAAGGGDLAALLDSVVSDLHAKAESSPDLPWHALCGIRTLVVRHSLYETGELEKGVALAEQYALRLRSLPDAPCKDADRRRILFGDDWVGFIGHLCLFDYYIKAKILGAMCWDELIVSAQPHMRVANRALLDRWRPWVNVLSDPAQLDHLGPGVERETVGTTMRVDGREWYWAAACAEIQARWEREGHAPLLQLTESDHARARPLLSRLGLPPGRPYVCVHAREPGYHKERGIASQSHRNADIMSFVPTMQFLVDNGFTVIRMGDPTMRPLPPMEGVIDYCHHPARDPWLDVYLIASARFFVGCTSGLVMVAHVFGTPTALSHFVPPCARPYTNRDLFLPRLYWSEPEGRVLSIEESLTPPLATMFYYDRIRALGIRVIDPSADDIKQLATEMFERSQGAAYTADDDQRQARYDALNQRVPWFGSNGRVGRDFLRARAALLD